MNCYKFTIDVAKLGFGDIGEIMEGLKDLYPDEITFDFIREKIHCELRGEEFDKDLIEEFLDNYADISWDCEE